MPQEVFLFYLNASLLVLSFFLGGLLAKRRLNAQRSKRAKELYSYAESAFNQGQYVRALAQVCEATGNMKYPQMLWLMGDIYDKMGLYDWEARCFFEAHWTYYESWPASSKTTYSEDVTYFYYRESRAHSRADDWEFSYIRANEAIQMIRAHQIPAMVDGEDYEQEMVAFRMMATLHHLRGTEAFEKSRADAQWLVDHSTKQLLRNIGIGVLTASDLLHNGKLEGLLWQHDIRRN